MSHNFSVKVLFVIFILPFLFFNIGCLEITNVTSVSDALKDNTGNVIGKVGSSSIANHKAYRLQILDLAESIKIQIGHFHCNGQFVEVQQTRTNELGEYEFKNVSTLRKNYILRTKVGDNELLSVVPEIQPDSTVIALTLGADSSTIGEIIREAAKQGNADKIIIADILSKLPHSQLEAIKNNPELAQLIAGAFLEREQSLDALVYQIGQSKLNELRSYAFEQTSVIINKIENAQYTNEEGWKNYDNLMSLKIKAEGFSSEVETSLQEIDQKCLRTIGCYFDESN